MSFCRIQEGELCAQQSEILKSIEKLELDYKDDYDFNISGKFTELNAQIVNLTKIKTDYKQVIDYLQNDIQTIGARKAEKTKELIKQNQEFHRLQNENNAVSDFSNQVLTESITLNQTCIKQEQEKNYKNERCQILGEKLDDLKRRSNQF